MNPFVVSLLANIAHDILKTGSEKISGESFEKDIRRAANEVAEKYENEDIQPNHFITAANSEELEKEIKNRSGEEQITTEDFSEILDDIIGKNANVNMTDLSDEFFNCLKKQIETNHPEFYRRSQTIYSQRQEQNMSEIQDMMGELRSDLKSQDNTSQRSKLRDEGFVRLSPDYFSQTSDPPEMGWRSGFTLRDVKDGRTIHREYDDEHRVNTTEEIINILENEHALTIIAPPGSGKSTICKSVAVQYYEENYGTIFYRESGTGNEFKSTGVLEEQISNCGESILIVVEDAANEESNAIFDVYKRIKNQPHSNATFLFDATTSDWESTDIFQLEPRTKLYKDNLRTYPVPPLDKIEYERIVQQFKDTTDCTDVPSPEKLFNEISTRSESEKREWRDSDPNEMYLLTHTLCSYISNFPLPDFSKDRITELNYEMKHLHSFLDSRLDDDLAPSVGMMINLLNAAKIDIRPELIHTLAENNDQHKRIDRILNALEGIMIFRTSGRPQYTPNHEIWSLTYLRSISESDMNEKSYLFDECASKILSIIDNSEKRMRIKRWLTNDADYLDEIESNSQKVADSLVRKIFDLGVRHPELSFLFKRGDESSIKAPDACSPQIWVEVINSRSEMYMRNSNYDDAEYELECLFRAIQIKRDYPGVVKELARIGFGNLGQTLLLKGKLEPAEDYLHQCYKLSGEICNRESEVKSYFGLGKVEQMKGELDRAEKCYQDSLEIAKEIGNESLEGAILLQLGNIFEKRGVKAEYSGDSREAKNQYAEAKKYFDKSKNIYKLLEDEMRLAVVNHNMGNILGRQNENNKAKKRFRTSLSVFQNYGDQERESRVLNSLGNLMDDPDEAKEFYQKSLDISEEIGNVQSEISALNNLSTVEINRENGDMNDARDWLESAYKKSMNYGIQQDTFRIVENLIIVCDRTDDLDSMHEWERVKDNITR